MDSRIEIDRVWLGEYGCRINYGYRATGPAARYFEGCPSLGFKKALLTPFPKVFASYSKARRLFA